MHLCIYGRGVVIFENLCYGRVFANICIHIIYIHKKNRCRTVSFWKSELDHQVHQVQGVEESFFS